MAVQAGGSNAFYDNTRLTTSSLIPHSVQNHLLDTKIYATVGENDIFHIRPSTIHFQGFQAGRKYAQKFRILNASSECQRMHIIPPDTNHFQVKYMKTDSLVPGMYLEVTVEFSPTENQYHYDCIRIHSKGNLNLIIPIYAYLVMDIATSFPSKINFNPTLVGDQIIKKIPLRNDSMGDFEFQIGFVENHKAFEIQPMSGLLPARKTLDIMVSFTPTEYCTMCATIQIVVSQFNSQPYYCKLTGSSEPGLASKLILKQLEESSKPHVISDQRVQTPLERSRIKKQTGTTKHQKSLNASEKEVVQDGIRFPKELNSQAAVAYILGQHAGKMKAKDIKKVVHAQTETTSNTKQVKQAIFEHIVSKNVSEEQRNQLRWCVNLGEEDVEDSFKTKINERTISSNMNKEDMIASDRSVTNTKKLRIHRKANTQTEDVPTFDLFLNDEWTQRHLILKKFIHAARKVIIRGRAQKNLQSLCKYLDLWRQKNFASVIPKIREDANKEQLIVENLCTKFDGKLIKPFAFPQYHDPNKPDDMAVNSLGLLDIPPTYVPVHNKVQLYKLKVPQQYKTLSYDQHLMTSMVHKHVPKKLKRKLRTGAENEITLVDCKPPTEVLYKGWKTLNDESVDDLQVLNLITEQLTMPSSFLEPKEYHPLHIFNPLPGVQTHPQPLPYSEIDEDYRLCPLPKSQALKLDRQLVIPEIMTWRKFPCQSLLVMNCPSLSNVYLPRWNDFSDKEFYSVITPPLVNSLPEDDVMEDTNENDSSYLPNVPNMDMLRAEFVLADDIKQDGERSSDNNSTLSPSLLTDNNLQEGGIITKEKLASDLDVHIRKQQNVLGEKIKSRIRLIQEEWKLS